MVDFMAIARLASAALLLAATAWLSDASFVGSAAAQSSTAAAERPLTSRQRRLLVERLSDRFQVLKRDVERGKQRVRADLDAWLGDERSPTMAGIFSGEGSVRSLPDGAVNVYEVAIKDYVHHKSAVGDDREWNPWPPDEKAAVKDQRDYAKCVLDRVDYFFETRWWRRAEKAIELTKQETPPTELSETIRAALSFNGGIGEYLQDSDAPEEAKQNRNLDQRRTCPFQPGPVSSAPTAVSTLPLSVGWNAKCLQSDKVESDGTVKPYHPTTAALMYDDGRTGSATYCSGTLIAPNAVLTAAHCVCDTRAKDSGGQFYRTAGACVNGSYGRLGRGVSALNPAHQTVFLQHAGHFAISSIVVHPQFRWPGELPLADLAILFLKTPVSQIAPAPLNTLGRLPPRTRAAAVGYGAHNPIGTSGQVTDTGTVLESTGLKLQANTETASCGPIQRMRNHICWRYQTSDRFGMRLGSTCRGDSGGPLYADSRGQTYLVGVTSGGGPSCQPTTAAFDIEVYAYKDWIQRQLAMNPPPRGNGPAPALLPAREGLKQFACHFCSLCDRLKASIETPARARRVHISVNCTPDDISRRSDLKLEVFAEPPESFDPGPSLCAETNPAEPKVGTAVSCPVEKVTPGQKLYISLKSGLLQQCQIVATAFERAN
jgi:secreted trypsin-like serine protease